MAKLIEKGTNYAYTIERIKDITFTKLRSVVVDFTRRLPADLNSELYEAIQHGVCQLQSEPELNMYIHALGLMHEAKLQHAFEHLPSEFTDHNAIEIIDYGCGQAIGTICYADFLRKNGYAQEVRKITLIEPSEIALKRAALHASCFFPNAEIITINKGFDDLVVDDLCIDEEIPTLHIFSNVLDLAEDYFNLEKFANLVKNCSKGENQYVCIEPYFEYDDKDMYPNTFFQKLGIEPYYRQIFQKGEFVEGREWTCFVIIGKADNDNWDCDNISSSQLKALISNGARYFKNCKIANATYSNDVVSLTLGTPINGYASTTNGIRESVGETNIVSISLYNIIGLFEDNEDWAWLKNTIYLYPFIVNRVFKDATIDIVQQYIQQGEKYNNPFSNNNKPQTCEQDIIVNHCVKIKLAKDGEEAANKVADLMMGFPMSDIELIMEFANDAENKNQYKEAFGYYKLAAEQGNAQAQFCIGRYYDIGRGVRRDYNEAVKWYRKAAEQDYVYAFYELEIIEYLRKPAEQGDVCAQFNTGIYYFVDGVQQDYIEAVKWFMKAAEQGHISAQCNLGYCYAYGLGVEQDYTKAIKWYLEATEQGCAEAQNNLGVCYAKGQGVGKDYTKAIKLYKKAAEQGNRTAQCNLGDCYKDGNGIKQDLAEAVKWYCKAAVQGDIEAQYNLGICYQNGQGVEQNEIEAQNWFRLAANGGHTKAKEMLDEV